MPYKIIVDVGQAEQRFVFVVRPWRNIQGLEDEVLCQSIKDADMEMVDRLDQRMSESKNQFYYFDIVKTIRQATVIVVICIPEEKTGKIAPNVIYELGLAHSLGKPTVIITTSDFELSDLAGRNLFLIDNYKKDELQARLTLEIKNAKANAAPEWIIDRATYKDIELASYGEVNRIKRIFEVSSKIKLTFTQLREGDIAKFNRLLAQLNPSNPEREIQSIVQTLDELKNELQEFEIYHDCILNKAILEYQNELDEIENLGKNGDDQAMIKSIKEQLTKFNSECGSLFVSIARIRNKFEEPQPQSQKDVRDILSDSLWNFKGIIGRTISNCDSLTQTCIKSI